MQFRVRPAAIQVLRSHYDPATKRTSNKQVARIPRATLKVKDEELKALSTQERHELDVFLAHYRNTLALQQQLNAHRLPDLVADVVAYFSRVEDAAEKEIIASQMMQAIIQFRHAIKTAA